MSFSRVGRFGCVALWCAGCCLLGYAGDTTQTDASKGEPQSPTIVTESREVALDLVVRDKRGRVVTDLKASELKILDAGSPVKISYIGPAQHDGSAPNLVVLYLDQLDNSAGQNARELVAKLMKSAPRVPVEYAVLGVSGRMRLFQNFTSDPEVVKTAVRVVTGDAKKGGPARMDVQAEQALLSGEQNRAVPVDEAALNHVLLHALREGQSAITEQHASAVMGGLLALAQSLRDAPGRKTILYFAEGQPTGPNAPDVLQTAIGAANRAGVAIYVIDAHPMENAVMQGLQVTSVMANLNSVRATTPVQSGPNTPPDITPPGAKTSAAETMGRYEVAGTATGATPLDKLAADTSGSLISLSQNPKRAFQRMFEDMASYYRVTYVPPDYEENGTFRKVSVLPLRKHIQIVSRSGYYAVPPPAGSRPFETALLRVLQEGKLPRDLPFESKVLHLGPMPAGNQHTLVVEVSLSRAEFVRDEAAQRYSAHLSMVSQIKNASGVVVAKFSEDVLRHGDLEQLESARAEKAAMSRSFVLPTGEYSLETVVMDRYSNKASAERQHIVISGQAAGPSLSDVVLVQKQVMFNPEVDADDPLRYEKTRILPTISEQIPDDAKTISFYLLLHPDAASSQRARLEMELRRDGQRLLRQPLPLRNYEPGATIPYMASLSKKPLPKGEYVLAAILTQGADSVERSFEFRIGEPEVAANGRPDSLLPSSTAPAYVDVKAMKVERVDTVDALSAEQSAEMLSYAAKRALGYLDGLPSFFCVERTSRSVDSSGVGRWRHKDEFAELLTYQNRREKRRMLEVNGHKSEVDRDELKGTLSVGEFGGLFAAVFRPESDAKLEWKYAATIGSSPVEAFAYVVDRAHSDFSVTDDSGGRATTGYHGTIFLDAATKDIRRITLESDGLPEKFVIRSTAISIDYDYVAIGGHDFLVPVTGTVSVDKGRRGSILNDVQFREYRKFSAESAIHFE